MPFSFSNQLDDELSFAREESFRGVNGFVRSTELPPAISQRGTNILIKDNLKPQTRPGIGALNGAAFDAGKVQGLAWFDSPSGKRLVAACNRKLYTWDGLAKAELAGYQVTDAATLIDMCMGRDKMFIADGVQSLRSWDPTAGFVDLQAGSEGVAGNAPIGSILCWHAGRLFIAGVASLPDGVWASDINDVGVGKFDWLRWQFRAGAGEGDDIVGMASLQGFNMGILKRDSLSVYNTDPRAASAAAWPLVWKTTGIGCVGRKAWVKSANDLFFLAPDGIRSVKRMESAAADYEVTPPLSEPMQPYIDRINWAYASTTVAWKFKQYVCFAVPLDNEQSPTTVLVWNERLAQWMGVWTGWTPTAFCTTRFNNVPKLIVGDSTGRVNQWKDGNSEDVDATYTDNDTAIETRLVLRAFTYGEPDSFKDAEWFVAEFDSTNTVFIDTYLDGTLAKTTQCDMRQVVNQLPLNLPFNLAVLKPGLATDSLIGLEQFVEQYFEIRSNSGKLALKRFCAAAFLNAVRLPKALTVAARVDYSGEVTPPTPPPAAPTELTAETVDESSIDLSWTNNGTADSVIVARATAEAGPYTDIATLAGSATNYSDTGLEEGTEYFYTVRARNEAGDSPSNVDSATTDRTVPAAPSALTAAGVSSSQINLAWTNNADNADNVIVSRSTTLGGVYTDIATLAASATSYSDTGLSALTEYYYKVRAQNTAGSSATAAVVAWTWSDQVTALYSAALVPFLSGASIAAGNYQLVYVGGAVRSHNDLGWVSNVGGGSEIKCRYYLAGVATDLAVPPDPVGYQTTWAASVAGNLANSVPVSFTHSGGAIGLIWAAYGNYYDDADQKSTYQLRRVS